MGPATDRGKARQTSLRFQVRTRGRRARLEFRVLRGTDAYPSLRVRRGFSVRIHPWTAEDQVVARSIRERIAVALLAGSVVVASVLGVMTVLSFTQGGAAGFNGQVAGAQAQQSSSTSGGGGSTTTSGGSGSTSQSQSGVSGGAITIGG